MKKILSIAASLLFIGSTSANINISSLSVRDWFTIAAEGNKEQIYNGVYNGFGVNTQDSMGRTPLHIAARAGNLEAIEALLACGADATMQDVTGKTPADFARTDDVRALLGQAQDPDYNQVSSESNESNLEELFSDTTENKAIEEDEKQMEDKAKKKDKKNKKEKKDKKEKDSIAKAEKKMKDTKKKKEDKSTETKKDKKEKKDKKDKKNKKKK